MEQTYNTSGRRDVRLHFLFPSIDRDGEMQSWM